MPCSPLLQEVTDPLKVLRIVKDHYLLRYSEPPEVFYPLEEKGWVTYQKGSWRITDKGNEALQELPEVPLPEFFEL